MRVAIGDDAVILREGLARLLHEAGFEVVGVAADAEELLELVERGLPVALEALCRRAGLPAHLKVDLATRLSDQVETAAYYFASEALSNAAKHSHGTEVRVDVSRDGHTLTVEVADDGIGGASVGPGSGLRGLADRVEALGGRFTVSSPPGLGTRLRAEIPCA